MAAFTYLRNSMKKYKSLFIGLSIAAVFVFSCKREELSWDLDLTVPVAYGTFGIDDLITDSLITENADGSLRIVYHSSVPGIDDDSLFAIPDTTLLYNYSLPFGTTTVYEGTFLTPTTPSQTAYGLAPIQLVYGTLEKGKMKVHLKNDIQKRVIVTYSITSATLNGNPLQVIDTLPPAPSPTVGSVTDLEVNLAGYELNFTGIAGDRVNTLTTLFTAQIDPTDIGAQVLTPPDSVSAEIQIEGLRPSYIRGYFGSELTHVGPDESYISFFSKVQSGSLGLDSLRMKFTVENYAGVDLRFTVNNLWSRSQRTGQTLYLNHPIIGTITNINRAAYSYSYPPSIPQINSWTFDNSNSNIVDMMEIMPEFLGYDFSIYTNPLGNVSGNNDFLYTQFGINASFDIDLPVNFYADNIVLVDTVDVDFSGVETNTVQNGILTVYANNGFPFDAGFQIYMLSETNSIIDSLVAPPGTVYSAPLATSGGYFFANGSTNSIVKIPMNEAQTSSLLTSTKLLIRPRFHTGTAPSFVKIFSTNRISLNITADFEYRINN
jgi:hypothetical protein